MYVQDTDTLAALKIYDSTSFSGFGAVAVYDSVKKLQSFLNKFASEAGYNVLTVDGKYGDKTQSALKKAVAWFKTTVPGSTISLPSSKIIDKDGPASCVNFLSGISQSVSAGWASTSLPVGLTTTQVADLQKPFDEYKASRTTSKPATGSPATQQTDAEERHGFDEGSTTATTSKSSLLWIVLGAAAVGVGYYLYSRKSEGA